METMKESKAKAEPLESQAEDLDSCLERMGEEIIGVACALGQAKRIRADERYQARAMEPIVKAGSSTTIATLSSEPRGVIFHFGYIPPSTNQVMRFAFRDPVRARSMLQDWWFDEIRIALEQIEPFHRRRFLPLRESVSAVLRYNMSGPLKDLDNYMVAKAIIDALIYTGVIIDDDAPRMPVIGHIEWRESPKIVPSVDLAVLEKEESVERLLTTYEGYFGQVGRATPIGYDVPEDARRVERTSLEETGHTELYTPLIAQNGEPELGGG